ncbi:PdxA: 4-hydroxythreonine-4-phosphate dehydrogenase [Desulfosarcina variabilis str. Montpellier]|uniref:4-hydroxythreonine-4-phosphate dehydrogenase PdxA n=1 Tax=Desulfosarcina variabilis TaxID=2300 RepID=UPI003AFA27AD
MKDLHLPLVAITMGDPVGIGPEIISKALCDPRIKNCCQPVVYGDARRLKAGALLAPMDRAVEEIASIHDARCDAHTLCVVNPHPVDTDNLAWGHPSAASGAAMAAYLEAAIDDALAGRISAIATGPINKYALKMANIHFNGHTEILAHRTGTQKYAMMLAGPRLKVVLATIHIRLKQVSKALSEEMITTVIALTDAALKTRFGLASPRIAVAGLNPHAGESGLFGDEETRVIAPAIESSASQGILASGPHPPDTIFYRASQGEFDAVVAMYHDQGLGPFKMVHFDDGVNTTLGLPIIRTSVDHGTAYDIAGKGIASAESMVAAITMAAGQARCLNRQKDQASI